MNPQGVYVQKPKWDVYTTMLLLSLVAIVIAIVMLLFEMKSYNWDIKANEATLQQAAVQYDAPVAPVTLA
jgi:hypothetical protein